MIDLIAVSIIGGGLSIGMLCWSHHRSAAGPTWTPSESFMALLMMIWCSSLGALIFMRAAGDSWLPDSSVSVLPAILGTGVGGLLTVAFIRLRASWAALGFVGCERTWILRAAACVPGFLGVSLAWGLLLEVLGVAAQQEIVALFMARWPSTEALLMVGYAVMVAPLVEELLFRGFLLPPLVARLGSRGGVALTAFLFGMMHISDPQAVPPLIVLGSVLGWLRLRSGSLWPALVLHVGNNAMAFVLLLLSQSLEP
ncbi:MAG: type II CAAX endopeptidase family protein [Myxococcota bacterium]|nr:type II CAAX endopeptidase family protein [Myxococcota bacterium]